MVGQQVSKSSSAQQFAQALMLEQIRFIKKQLLSEPNNPYIKQFIHHLYHTSDQILLKQVIQLDALQDVISKYAFELNLGAEILEFIGIIAQKIHSMILNRNIYVQDLFSDQSFELWLFKILELTELRQHLQRNLEQNPRIQQVSLQLANQIIENSTPWLNHLRTTNVNSKILNFIQDQQHSIELKLEQKLAKTLLEQLGQIILLPSEELSEMCLHIWQDLKQRRLSDIFAQFEAIDVEEFFILVYETWRQIRKNGDMRQLILDIVACFHEYFADYNVQQLCQAVGLDEADLQQEAARFLPYTLHSLEQKGLLDDILKALIIPFYTSADTHQFIEQYLQDQQ